MTPQIQALWLQKKLVFVCLFSGQLISSGTYRERVLDLRDVWGLHVAAVQEPGTSIYYTNTCHIVPKVHHVPGQWIPPPTPHPQHTESQDCGSNIALKHIHQQQVFLPLVKNLVLSWLQWFLNDFGFICTGVSSYKRNMAWYDLCGYN